MNIHEYQAMASTEQTHWWFVTRRALVARIFDQFGIVRGGKRSIVDIGAGTGGMMRFLGHYGSVIGIEPHAAGRNIAKNRHIILRKGSAGKTGLPSTSFDIVCFFDVLYHRGIDDGKALREAYRLLKKGGKLVITDCAMPFLYGPNDRAVGGRQRYTIRSMTDRVVRAGFRIRRSSYLFFLVFPLFLFKRLVDKIMVKQNGHSDVHAIHPIINTFLLWVGQIETILFGWVRYPWGSSLMLVATKD